MRDFAKFEETKKITQSGTGDSDIEVDISDASVRFLVSLELAMEHGSSFDQAVEYVREFCGSRDSAESDAKG